MKSGFFTVNYFSMAERALKASVSPFARTFLVAIVIAGFLYFIYTRVQRVKRARQRNRRRHHQESRRLAAEEAKRKLLTSEERYLKGKAGTMKVLLAAEVIFDDDVADDAKEISFREGVPAKLNTMCGICDVFIVVKQETKEGPHDEDSAINRSSILSAFKKAGILEANGFKSHRIIICSTSSGKGHIARHILPHLYMDVELEPLKMVSPFIQDTILIGVEGSDRVKAFPSMVEFLTPVLSTNKSDRKVQQGHQKHGITVVRKRTKKVVHTVLESNKE
mmetsp:Transcript_24609/g.34390  ORF Transcript_24609/g.34390 Transcript_24609/m.34390 type:complete len:278 (-) Transcript_24609:194-1027(-)|eukprot:CAMPEP_0185278822 /NCGR_PEP_ID=MMETSP1359-20130426/61975_1 /TAXON_ID=552665 /ORGANISM="Bigelowiella longifila, Strain CCMP242" /LENGTH=277 /DNA_ID=CAMNT_0027873469 /DNA_START=28 /DNA_END=861 /DNA_ORIENTATION=+